MQFVSRRFPRLALPCVAFLAAGFTSQAMAADEYVKQYSVTGRPTVHIRMDDGNIKVITSDSQQVEFRVKYEGYTLDRTLHIDSSQEGDRVELIAKTKAALVIGLSIHKLSAEIRMPKNADLQIVTGDGDVDVNTVNGAVTIQSGDGRLKVAQLTGDIDLHTGDGNIDANTLKGAIKMRTGDGAINASNIDGRCAAQTGDGAVRLSGRFDGLDVHTGDGSVSARADAGSMMTGAWQIRTGDGPVDIGLPKDLKANLDLSTSDGHITLGLPVTVEGKITPSRVSGTMNGGGPALVIRSGDGSIRLNTTS